MFYSKVLLAPFMFLRNWFISSLALGVFISSSIFLKVCSRAFGISPFLKFSSFCSSSTKCAYTYLETSEPT